MEEVIDKPLKWRAFTDRHTHALWDSRCSFLPGGSVCRRGRKGEGLGSGMDETSWVWSGNQWGLSSSKAVSSSIRICSSQNPHSEYVHMWISTDCYNTCSPAFPLLSNKPITWQQCSAYNQIASTGWSWSPTLDSWRQKNVAWSDNCGFSAEAADVESQSGVNSMNPWRQPALCQTSRLIVVVWWC